MPHLERNIELGGRSVSSFALKLGLGCWLWRPCCRCCAVLGRRGRGWPTCWMTDGVWCPRSPCWSCCHRQWRLGLEMQKEAGRPALDTELDTLVTTVSAPGEDTRTSALLREGPVQGLVLQRQALPLFSSLGLGPGTTQDEGAVLMISDL